MSLFDSLNTTTRRTIREDINLSAMAYKPLKDFIGQTIKVDGFFFTDGRFGKQVVVVGNGYKINLPKREVAKFERIDQDDNMLGAMLEGHLILTNIEKWDTNIGTSVKFKYDFV